MAGLALLGIPFGWLAAHAMDIRERGWWGAVPTTALIYFWRPRGDDYDWDAPKTALEKELFDRRDCWAMQSDPENHWWEWQRVWYCERILEAKEFEKNDPMVVTADRWPVDGRVFVQVRRPGILPSCSDMRIRERGGEWQSFHFCRGSDDVLVRLGPVSGAGRQSVTVDLEAREGSLILWRGSRKVEYDGAGNLASSVATIDNPSITEWLADGLTIWPSSFDFNEPWADKNAWHVQLSVKVDVLRRGIPVATGFLSLGEGYVPPNSPIREGPRSLALSWQPGEIPLDELPDDTTAWTYRVSGSPELAAGADSQSSLPVRVWNGQFTHAFRQLDGE